MVGKRGGYAGADQVVEIHMDAQGHETLSYSHNLELRSDQCKGMVWWVHPPKTGTSFAASVERCERAKGRSKELHQNLPVEASDEILKTMVGMFRDPEERLLSAYHWIHRVPSCCIEDWGWQSVVFTKTKHEITQGVPAPKALGRFQGCYTNMIAGGAGCMSEHKPTSEEMREALRRVGLFRFVGLTGEWTLSTCLFNFITEGRRFVTKGQLHNARPTFGTSHTTYNITGMPEDPWDGQIFEVVQRRFWSDIRKYGISLQTCPME